MRPPPTQCTLLNVLAASMVDLLLDSRQLACPPVECECLCNAPGLSNIKPWWPDHPGSSPRGGGKTRPTRKWSDDKSTLVLFSGLETRFHHRGFRVDRHTRARLLLGLGAVVSRAVRRSLSEVFGSLIARPRGSDGGCRRERCIQRWRRDPHGLPRWRGARSSHHRYVADSSFILITSDRDIYVDDLVIGGDVVAIHVRPVDRGLFGMAPPGHLHDCQVAPTTAQWNALLGESREAAQRERDGRQRVGSSPAQGGDPVEATFPYPVEDLQSKVGLSALALGGPAAGPPGLQDPFGGVGWFGHLANLLGAAPLPQELVPVGAEPGVEAPSDHRVMNVYYNDQGLRNRECQYAFLRCSEDDWPDWPMSEPRTVRWYLRHNISNSGTPKGWHQRWMADCKLSLSDGGVDTHSMCCDLLQQMLCYDQLNVANLACAESIAWELQNQEERYADRVLGKDDHDEERSLYAGRESAGHLYICPALKKFVGEQLRTKNVIAKERRKAREERGLAKPPRSSRRAHRRWEEDGRLSRRSGPPGSAHSFEFGWSMEPIERSVKRTDGRSRGALASAYSASLFRH